MRPEKVWQKFFFIQNSLILMHLRTYRSFCGGPAIDACARLMQAARKAASVPAFVTVSANAD